MTFFSNRRTSDAAENTPDAVTSSTAHSPVGFDTVVGASCAIEGTLRSDANIRLDGQFSGTLEITGNVLVGETAKITADINARNISIAGTVRGNVTGKKVQLLRTARVWGDITATALATEEGAFIDGKISMMSEPAEHEERTHNGTTEKTDHGVADAQDTAPADETTDEDNGG